MLGLKSPVPFSIKHILHFAWCVLVLMCSVLHLLRQLLVASKCYEAWYEGYVCEFLTRFPVLMKFRFFAIWALTKIFVGVGISSSTSLDSSRRIQVLYLIDRQRENGLC